ncbi:MAG: hypothetical protein RL268_37 [Pseudomonadota bacterium]|jgi:hypothetical protein
MPANTSDALPQEGGTYLRQPDGSLLRVDRAVDLSEDLAPAEPPAPTQE